MRRSPYLKPFQVGLDGSRLLATCKIELPGNYLKPDAYSIFGSVNGKKSWNEFMRSGQRELEICESRLCTYDLTRVANEWLLRKHPKRGLIQSLCDLLCIIGTMNKQVRQRKTRSRFPSALIDYDSNCKLSFRFFKLATQTNGQGWTYAYDLRYNDGANESWSSQNDRQEKVPKPVISRCK